MQREDADYWTGKPGPGVGNRMFGGHALAQALMAASLAETGKRVAHSLHAHFLKLGEANAETAYRVLSLTEGRSFATRRVDAFQGDTHVLTMTVSFHIEESGFAHADNAPDVPNVPIARAALEDWKAKQENFDQLPILGRLWERPVETIPTDPDALFGDTPREPRSASWMRARNTEQVDAARARAQLAYASDMLFLRNALLPHGVRPGAHKMQIASLDHAIWFHQTPDFADWHLYAGESPWAGGARGYSRGQFFSQEGAMVASVAQENLMRVRQDR